MRKILNQERSRTQVKPVWVTSETSLRHKKFKDTYESCSELRKVNTHIDGLV